ncbi:MAG: hypothetical protein MUF42_09350 [Cytophagaceae bacterium]|jgi:hypothetical protein|nr:hypothetical protein [Cytophagaceae bacterium]
MIYQIESENTYLISRLELTEAEWTAKLLGFQARTSFSDATLLQASLTKQWALSEQAQNRLAQALAQESVQVFRYFVSQDTPFTIEAVFLDVRTLEGKLIFWKDWSYIFQEVGGYYQLWCQLEGRDEVQREIRLSLQQADQYQREGIPFIQSLLSNLMRPVSEVYDAAVKEHRRLV